MLAVLARLAGRSVWLLGFVGRWLGPWSLRRSTLGEVGGLFDGLEFRLFVLPKQNQTPIQRLGGLRLRGTTNFS